MNDTLRLDSENRSLLLSTREAIPEIIYWGAKLAQSQAVHDSGQEPVPQASLDQRAPLSLSVDAGRGLFCRPGIAGQRQGKDWSPVFSLTKVETIAQGLVLHCEDPVAQLAVSYTLILEADTDLLRMWVALTNHSEQDYELQHCDLSLPLPSDCAELETFGGRWCQEFKPHRQRLDHGSINLTSRYGRTSQQKQPFYFIGRPGFSETQGRVYGFQLAWSGDHAMNFELLDSGQRLVQLGEHLASGELVLKKQQTYQSPEVLMGYSDSGTNGISQSYHQHIRQKILHWPEARPRPVILNTWEGIYFDHDPDYILRMIDRSAELGVERFVLDDGWFKGRNDEHSSLGDWYLDTQKYPQGLTPLIDRVNQHGMEFGIWMEPEMVNPDSDLFRAHPDWILSLEGYEQPMGRYQYVLDLQQTAVSDYLFERIDELLTDNDIRYIKWDMNRELVQPGHKGYAANHGQTISLYRLLERIRAAHPRVEIESCSSGGGRIDLGILPYVHRYWTSDCNDALERVMIQSHFMRFLPPELMGAHMGAPVSHTTGRQHQLSFRALVALFGHFGLELDPVKLSESEIKDIQYFVALHKAHRELLHSGRFSLLTNPGDPNLLAWQVVGGNREQALAVFIQKTITQYSVPPLFPLTDLDPQRDYRVTVLHGAEPRELGPMKQLPGWLSEGTRLNGDWLMRAGLQLPVMQPESAFLVKLEAL
ncbi:alpha-galactosidase [Marinimicrobium sp. C2-29]|uniref:alpha-galactosidase n=1 Tax=Marinimicrobium sp. C2-29 TaxID=3139825 RepID=UPI003139FCB4